MNDFDFLFGTWDVANRRLKTRLVGSDDWEEFASTAWCKGMFRGAANIDEIVFADGSAGLTLRLYHPSQQEWSLYWSSSTTGVLFPPLTGRFTGGVGTFYGDDVEGGVPVKVRFIWSRITPESARWEQAMSLDTGQTWETNWYMDFTRRS
jgi:hypothetical protein